jgi:creatinine amidohydrolase
MRPAELRRALQLGWPLLLPTGSVEYHGPHLPLGVDTVLTQELCRRVALRIDAVIAPALAYGPTGYAVSGPDQGTVDVSTERFGRHAKDVLTSLWDIGFRWIIVVQHHQQLDGPEALAIRQAASEVIFERALQERGPGWWGRAPMDPGDNAFQRIQLWPSVLPPADQIVRLADHAGFYETALMLGCAPELVALERLGMDGPWFTATKDSRARAATPPQGAAMWDAMTAAWVSALQKLTKPPRPTPDQLTVTGLF